MPRGAQPGQRRGGRVKGTPNKLPKGERALVKLDDAETEVRALKAEGLPLDTLGKDRLAELDAWAHAMAKQFAPKKNRKTGRMYWENDGDEARFVRFMKLCGEFSAARAAYESPRLSAIAAGKLGSEPDVDDDPHERLMRIIDNWIAANEAEKAERAIDVTPGADAMPMTREGEPDTVARGGTGGLIPPTGANDDDGIDGELIDVTPKPEPEPAAVETKPDLEDGVDGEMA